MKKLILHCFAAVLFASLPVAAKATCSTTNPTVPAQNAPMASAPIRSNFQAIYNDTNNLMGKFNGATAPIAPCTRQDWFDTTSNPWTWKIYDGSTWATVGTLNTSTHTFTPVSGGAPGGAAGGDLGGTYPNPTVLHLGNVTDHSFNFTTGGTGTLPLTYGGLGIASGTSGGIPYFSASSTIASSTVLGANELIVGGGSGGAPVTLSSPGTTTTLLHGNASGAPTFGAVSMTADVSGILPSANGGTANAFFTVSGPTTSTKTFTFPDANATIARTDAGQTFTGANTFSSAITYGGVTLSNAVTGTGNMVLSASPTFTGTITGAAATLTGTLTTNLTGGGTQCVQASNTGVLSGTGASCTSGLVVGSTSISGGSGGRVEYNNAGVLGEMTTTGSGTVLALATTPTFVTSITTPIVNGASTEIFQIGGVEKARLTGTDSGHFMVGAATDGGFGGGSAVSGFNNSTVNSVGLTGDVGSTATAGAAILARVAVTNSSLMAFYYNGFTQVGTITTNGTVTAYNTTSDRRLKNNITDAADPGAILDALDVRQWDWKTTGVHEDYGFVAQEEYKVAPFAVRKGDDDPVTISAQWGRDDSKLVPLLVKEVQLLRARVAALEAKNP